MDPIILILVSFFLVVGVFALAPSKMKSQTYLYQPQDASESELLVKAKESLERCEKYRKMSESRETQKIIEEITESLKSSGKVEINVWGEERAKFIGDYFANKGFNCSYKYVKYAETGNPLYCLKISPIGGPANREIVTYVSDYGWTG